MKFGNPIENAKGLAQMVYYGNKARQFNAQADKMRAYNKVKGKDFEPGSTGFQMQSVGRQAMQDFKSQALKNKQ